MNATQIFIAVCVGTGEGIDIPCNLRRGLGAFLINFCDR